MKTCLLNLPYQVRIMRRYACTYRAPNFLLPPLELMYLAAIISEWKKDACILIDAVAEGLTVGDVIERLKDYKPDLLVFMAGIESFSEDMATVGKIKSSFPSLKIVCLGYLPSIFPQKTLQDNPVIDFIIMGEPEMSFSELYDILKEKNNADITLPGIAARANGVLSIGVKRERIKNLDTLPFLSRRLLKNELYSEPFMPKPFTVMQTQRGCPFSCAFCISTYGNEVACQSVENVLQEIEQAVLKYNIKSIRFMDDTFTLDEERVISLCDLIKKKNLKFKWSCLSRVDTLDSQMLGLMKEAGCKRIYLGIESASQRVLDFYKKNYKAARIKETVEAIKRRNIQAVGFFIVGGIQTEEEFMQDISLSKELKLDFIIVEKLSRYPGTALFDSKPDMCSEEEALERERIFYRRFYLRHGYCLGRLKDFIFNIKDAKLGAQELYKFLLFPRLSCPTRREMI